MNRFSFEALDNRDTPAPFSLTSLVPITSPSGISQTQLVYSPTTAPARGIHDCENTVFLSQRVLGQPPPPANLHFAIQGTLPDTGNAGNASAPTSSSLGWTATPPPPLHGIEGSDAGGDTFPGLPIDYSFLVCEDEHVDHVGEDGNSCEPPPED